MQNHYAVNIKRESKPSSSFRVSCVRNEFDYQNTIVQENITGVFDIPDEWNIGCIVGGSGTGKTTILNDIFPDTIVSLPTDRADSVIDDMPDGASVKDIEMMFTSIGFSSVPSWLKPYRVLSNGEKMRADLAYTLLSANDGDIVSFDEFTSVVDRDVAKNLSVSLQKTVRRTGKRFIAVTCHRDVLDWLQPDWCFDTDKGGMIDPKCSSPQRGISLSDAVGVKNGEILAGIII